jgi:SAM-dependent methyltransferase
MNPVSLAPYERSLRNGASLSMVSSGSERLELTLDIARYLAPVDDDDQTVLDRCVGPVLDIGCGPGRFVRALAERGVATLGLDIADAAVSITRELGGQALRRSVFDAAPAEGRWPTVLLMDGNIGIGGDVPRLLNRTRRLLAARGRAIIEAARDAQVDRCLRLHFRSAAQVHAPSFPWSEVGIVALCRYGREAGYSVGEIWSSGGRTFVALDS